jgi:hypothetical protein
VGAEGGAYTWGTCRTRSTKLEVLNIECDKGGRRRRYRVYRLLALGIDVKLLEWSDEAS